MKWRKGGDLRGLVLQRKAGEKIVVNNGELIIEIIEIKGSYVKLAFQAAPEISIRRAESVKDAAS